LPLPYGGLGPGPRREFGPDAWEVWLSPVFLIDISATLLFIDACHFLKCTKASFLSSWSRGVSSWLPGRSTTPSVSWAPVYGVAGCEGFRFSFWGAVGLAFGLLWPWKCGLAMLRSLNRAGRPLQKLTRMGFVVSSVLVESKTWMMCFWIESEALFMSDVNSTFSPLVSRALKSASRLGVLGRGLPPGAISELLSSEAAES